MIVTEVRDELFSFFLPHFPGAPKSERPLLPRRAGALWEGPVRFGRNRESRRREAAGRRNYPEAVPNGEGGNKDNAPKRILTVIAGDRSHRTVKSSNAF